MTLGLDLCWLGLELVLELGLEFGLEFGFGSPTGLELAFEDIGLAGSSQKRRYQLGKQVWICNAAHLDCGLGLGLGIGLGLGLGIGLGLELGLRLALGLGLGLGLEEVFLFDSKNEQG